MSDRWYVRDVMNRLPRAVSVRQIPKPVYLPDKRVKHNIGMAVSSMRQHMTDEGWQLFAGLQAHGYTLVGHGFSDCDGRQYTDTRVIMKDLQPSTLVIQDKREWDYIQGRHDFRDPQAFFHNVQVLKGKFNTFKLTVLKDAQQRPHYHRDSADEMGIHAWIIYYHPDIVCKVAPYVRKEHLVRTYHSLDPRVVPDFVHPEIRYDKAIISGAVSGAYPLRRKIIDANLKNVYHLPHPGYHRNGCQTPQFLNSLSQFKVSICTASMYGYSLRKLIEATACGCRVITDLPCDDRLPFIDDNLVRIRPDMDMRKLEELVQYEIERYNPCTQRFYAHLAVDHYDYKNQGMLLARDIEALRVKYND